MEILPTQTLYVNNINDKLKTDVLKKLVYSLFSQYGRVMDIVAKKGVKNRGQAWVVFQDVSAATNALRGKQGFVFYGKPIVSILKFYAVRDKIITNFEKYFTSLAVISPKSLLPYLNRKFNMQRPNLTLQQKQMEHLISD